VSARRFLFTTPFVRIWLIAFAAMAGGFLLFPTAPLRLTELGAPTAAAGLFLTLLTFGSALSAAWTGSIGDLLGRRRVLTAAGLLLAGFAALYAVIGAWWLLPALALVHGVVWSALLTGGSAEATTVIPAERRAEGIGWFGMASTLAIMLAPVVGLWLEARDWRWLCAAVVALDLAVAGLARSIPASPPPPPGWWRRLSPRQAIEWRVLRSSAVLLLVSFGYGGVTSFVPLLAEERGIEPKGIFFAAFALSILVLRPALGSLVDRVGAHRAVPPSIALAAAGLALIPFQDDAAGLAIAGLVFGAGFSTLYPAFSTLMLSRVAPDRHGATFGAMLAAFDIGIGSGSLVFGPVVAHAGVRAAFLGSAVLAFSAWPLLRRIEPEPR
jgi:MFS family permease